MFHSFLSYLIFILIPAEGSWIILNHLHTIQPEGGFFMHLVEFIQSRGTVRCGAIPSSYVTTTFVVLWGAFKYQRKLAYWLLPFSFGIALSTVYCRYHHAIDAIAGIIMGTCYYILGITLLKMVQKRKQNNIIQHV